MPLDVKNLAFIRSIKPGDPQLGARLYEALRSIETAHNNVESQVNGNSKGLPQTPPALNAINVTAQNGHFNVALTDNNQVYRGIRYYVQHSAYPDFRNAVHTQASGSELRNHNEFLGNVTRYFRAYSAYNSSGPSAPVYHGGGVPVAVTGGGTIGGPFFHPTQGTGTGPANGSVSGPGPTPFRSSTGAPPTRT